MDDNSVHGIVHSQITHEHFWDKKMIIGNFWSKVSFSCMEMSFSCLKILKFHIIMHGNEIFMHESLSCMEMKYSCMKVSCHDLFSCIKLFLRVLSMCFLDCYHTDHNFFSIYEYWILNTGSWLDIMESGLDGEIDTFQAFRE